MNKKIKNILAWILFTPLIIMFLVTIIELFNGDRSTIISLIIGLLIFISTVIGINLLED